MSRHHHNSWPSHLIIRLSSSFDIELDAKKKKEELNFLNKRSRVLSIYSHWRYRLLRCSKHRKDSVRYLDVENFWWKFIICLNGWMKKNKFNNVTLKFCKNEQMISHLLNPLRLLHAQFICRLRRIMYYESVWRWDLGFPFKYMSLIKFTCLQGIFVKNSIFLHSLL